MWFLPLLLVGAIAVAVAKRSSRNAAPRQLAAPRMSGTPILAPMGRSGRSLLPPGIPGPISVLGEMLKCGQSPTPTVILCSIAEAQSLGRDDLASDIVQAFVVPVVQRHQRACGRGERGNYARGSCAVVQSPRHAVDTAFRSPGACLAVPPPPSIWQPDAAAATTSSPQGASSSPTAVQNSQNPSTSSSPSSSPSVPLTDVDDEIIALLHADPVRFMDMVSRSGGMFSGAPQVMQPQAKVAVPTAVPSPAVTASVAQPTGLPPDIVGQMQEAARAPEAAARTRALAPGSPIPGVSDLAWRDFVIRLERESPNFESSRHVGQYRQRRERLAELGINPAAIANSPEAQRHALDADLADAHRHGVASDMFAQHLGRPISLPGVPDNKTITLSGVLGVIQCAGLEGAAGWLETPNDRKRFPHTTQSFLRTNGVF